MNSETLRNFSIIRDHWIGKLGVFFSMYCACVDYMWANLATKRIQLRLLECYWPSYRHCQFDYLFSFIKLPFFRFVAGILISNKLPGGGYSFFIEKKAKTAHSFQYRIKKKIFWRWVRIDRNILFLNKIIYFFFHTYIILPPSHYYYYLSVLGSNIFIEQKITLFVWVCNWICELCQFMNRPANGTPMPSRLHNRYFGDFCFRF